MPSSSSSGAQDNEEFKAGDQDKKPFTAISKNLFFHDRPEEKTFQLLIDTQRMRQQDEYSIDGINMPGSIYDKEPSSEKAFREFIRKAQGVPGYLPPWWKETSTDDCIEYARNSTGFSLAAAQEKQDIQKTWGDDRMPMKLRMVAERVYGNTPGGFKGDSMLAMMAGQEGGGGGGGFSSHLDIAGLMRGAR
jgi:splicing suppressor protein 51